MDKLDIETCLTECCKTRQDMTGQILLYFSSAYVAHLTVLTSEGILRDLAHNECHEKRGFKHRL